MPTGASASRGWARSRACALRTSCGVRPSCRPRHGPAPKTGDRTSCSTRVSPSSFSVPIQPAALDLLSDLSKVLSSWGAGTCSATQAVIAYGVPRLSADVDVTLRLVPDEPERFARDMEGAGFGLRVDDPDSWASGRGPEPKRPAPRVRVDPAAPIPSQLTRGFVECALRERERRQSGRPSKPATEMSSSTSGQWIPVPGPISLQ